MTFFFFYNSIDLNAKNVQLPDLIKESSNLKEIEIMPPSKQTIIEEKSSPSESLDPPKDPDVTSTKTETPTPLVETKNIEEALSGKAIKPTQFNGESLKIDNQRQDENKARISPSRESASQVDWEKQKRDEEEKEKQKDEEESSSEDLDEMDSDSLSSTDEEGENKAKPFTPPKLQIFGAMRESLLDKSIDRHQEEGTTFEPDSIECSYLHLEDPDRPPDRAPPPPPVTKEIEIVNSNLKSIQIQDELGKNNFSGCSSPTSHISGKTDDSEENDVTTAAYTETEFSEWARDGDNLVSEDLRDVEYDMNPEYQGKGKRPSNDKFLAKIANGEDLTDVELDFSQEELAAENNQLPNTIASKLLANGEEDIGFMDTDNESLLEEDSLKEITRPRNRGYIEFVNVKTPSTPVVAPIAKSELEYDESSDAQTPCCEDKDMNVIEFDPVTMDDVRDRLRLNGLVRAVPCEIKVTDCDKDEPAIDAVNKDLMSLSMDEDSLLIVEPSEDTTTSEVVTVLASPNNPLGGRVGSLNDKEENDDDDTSSDRTKTPEAGKKFFKYRSGFINILSSKL